MRESGYYWVSMDNEIFEIAKYDSVVEQWRLIGDYHWYDDKDFVYINENRLKHG